MKKMDMYNLMELLFFGDPLHEHLQEIHMIQMELILYIPVKMKILQRLICLILE